MTSSSRRTGARASLAVLCAFSTLAPVLAATEPATAEAQSRYQAERARCINGKSGQALDTCLKEAGAAKAIGDGQLTAADQTAERKRCEPLKGDEKRDCLARAGGASGNTKSSGSVQGGGIVRETTTTSIPTPVSPAASSSR